MKALIVDDQPNVRLLLSSILRQKAGCTVIEATNGIEALDVLAREPFDFVVLDVLMPMMDGLETLEAIRRAPPLRHLPVIVLSAVRDEAKVRQLVGHGVTAYLAKPLRPLEVAARIQEIIPRLAPANTPPTRPVLPGTDVSRADLRPHMIRATEQVFGMMLGLDVLAIGTDRRAVPDDDVVRVGLRLVREDVDLEFTITAPRAMTERMTAQYLRAADVVGDADVSHTLRKVAAIIGSRLQTTLRQRGAEVTLGEPAVSRLGRDGDADPGAMHVCFASRAEALCFTTTLRAVPGAPLAAARPTMPAARTVTMDTPMPPAVDPEVLEMLASLQEPGEPDLVVELVSLFLRDTPERLRDLDTRPLDGARTVRVAHAVKGSAGNLGAMHLQDLASRLEQAAHLGRPSDELAALADAVNVEYTRVARHLEGVVAGRADAGPPVREH